MDPAEGNLNGMFASYGADTASHTCLFTLKSINKHFDSLDSVAMFQVPSNHRCRYWNWIGL